MTLLGRALSYLESRNVTSALIGGGALAVHGVARATEDLDLLAVETRILDPAFWTEWSGPGEPEPRRGDAEDPLAGVVRLADTGSAVDVIVGKEAWMPAVLARRFFVVLSGEKVPVVEAADLVLTKLAARGPLDLLDVRLLLGGISGLGGQVEERLAGLPSSLREAWSRIPIED